MNISQHVFFDLGIKDVSSYFTLAGALSQNPGVYMDKVGTDMSTYFDSFNISMCFFPSFSVGSQFYSQRRLYSVNYPSDVGLGKGAYLSPDAAAGVPSPFTISPSIPDLFNLFTLVGVDYGFFPRCIFWYEY